MSITDILQSFKNSTIFSSDILQPTNLMVKQENAVTWQAISGTTPTQAWGTLLLFLEDNWLQKRLEFLPVPHVARQHTRSRIYTSFFRLISLKVRDYVLCGKLSERNSFIQNLFSVYGIRARAEK